MVGMARIGWLFISVLFCINLNAQVYPYKVAAKTDTVAVIKNIGGVNKITVGDIVKLGDTSNINELQVIDTFSYSNDTLRISLSKDNEKYKAVSLLGSDKQKADTFLITSNQLRLSLERDGVPFYSVNLAPYLDNTDGQTLSIAGNTLSISGGNSVTLPITTYTAGTGINITGNVISNTGDLSNSNELQVYSHSGTTSYTNTLSLSGGSFSIIAGTNMAISHNGSGVITLNASTGSNTNIYNSNGSLTANRIVGLAGYNLEFNGTGNIYLNNSGRIGLFLNSTPFTAFSNSTTGIQDGNANNASVDGILWQSFGTGYAFTSYSGFSHGLHTRVNSTLAAYKILNCSSGSTATDRFTVFGNGVVRIQGLPNAQCLATNSSGDVVAATFPNQIQAYSHSGTSSYTNTLSSGGGSFSLLPGTNITLSHNGSGSVTINASGGGAGWLTTGNAGTNPTSNYLGTTDAQDLSLRTQGTEVLRLKVGGMIGQGTASPSYPYHMVMGGTSAFKRETTQPTIRDAFKTSSTSEFYTEASNVGLPRQTFKIYSNFDLDGGLFVEDNCSRSIFGLNYVKLGGYGNTRNDVSTSVVKNTLYTDAGAIVKSCPAGTVGETQSTNNANLTTSHRLFTVPSSTNLTCSLNPMASGGQVLYLKRDPASAGTGNVVLTSSTLIDSASSYTLTSASSGVVLAYNSATSNWYVIAKL